MFDFAFKRIFGTEQYKDATIGLLNFKMERLSPELAEEGREEGLAEGEAKGLAAGRAEIAKNLLKAGVDIKIIAQCTGLDEATIRSL